MCESLSRIVSVASFGNRLNSSARSLLSCVIVLFSIAFSFVSPRNANAALLAIAMRSSKVSITTPIGDTLISKSKKWFCSRRRKRSSFSWSIMRLNTCTMRSASCCPTGANRLLKSCARSKSIPPAMEFNGLITLL